MPARNRRGKSRKGRIGTTRPFPYLSGRGKTSGIPIHPVGPARANKAPQSSASTAALCNYHQDAPSGTGLSVAELFQADRFRAEDKDDQAKRHRQECCLRIPAAIFERR